MNAHAHECEPLVICGDCGEQLPNLTALIDHVIDTAVPLVARLELLAGGVK